MVNPFMGHCEAKESRANPMIDCRSEGTSVCETVGQI